MRIGVGMVPTGNRRTLNIVEQCKLNQIVRPQSRL